MSGPKRSRRIAEDPELAAIYRQVGRGILAARRDMGVSQRQACEDALGSAKLQGEWSRWEHGITLPNIATLYRIAVWAGISLGQLGLFEPPEAPVSHLRMVK